MPTMKNNRTVVEDVSNFEYYDMVDTFDDLYQRSKDGERFTNLMDIILSENNILLAYSNIKAERESQIPGTDKLTIKDIEKKTLCEVVETVRFILGGSKHGYRPKPVKRKEIPKPNGMMRPIGIPCIWDCLIQQCIKQVLEPICEAKFSNNSYGFRPNRCVEHAIAETHRLMQRSGLSYAVKIKMDDFYENINHSKLIRQLWSLGIQDKTLLYYFKKLLLTPVRLPNGDQSVRKQGIVQTGKLGPLLVNVALNELDRWIESQWQNHPMIRRFKLPYNKQGKLIKSNAYLHMRKTNLKEMFVLRYADEIVIFCRKHQDAVKVNIAVCQWLLERLRLKTVCDKGNVYNLRHEYMEFLGYKLKLYDKGNGWKVKSHVSDQNLNEVKRQLKHQFKKIAHAKNKQHTTSIVRRYNVMVMDFQDYYSHVTDICKDFREVQHQIDVLAKTGLHMENRRDSKLSRRGRVLTAYERERFGKSLAMRYIKMSGEPIFPIGYVHPKPPISKAERVCLYTAEGRRGLQKKSSFNLRILKDLMNNSCWNSSAEFIDNKLMLYSSQKGKCAVTRRVFKDTKEIHCHHIVPLREHGTNQIQNLVLVLEPIHKLIHARNADWIQYHVESLELTKPQIDKLNTYRKMVGNQPIVV